MRRYTPARNPIEALRERWGLGETEQSQSVPDGEGPSVSSHPLPTTPGQALPKDFLPLPTVPGAPLDDPPPPSSSGTVDYEARQRSQLDEVRQGGIAEPVSVYPNWESRREGMRDFLAPTTLAIQELPTPATIELSAYEVPQGFTAFWKQFRFFLDPLPAGLTATNTLVTLLVDGLIVPDYFNLPLGPFMAEYQDTFVIAAQGRRLSLRVAFTVDVGIIDNVTAWGLLYGNVGKRSGEAENREVGVRPPPPLQPPEPVSDMPPFRVKWSRPPAIGHAAGRGVRGMKVELIPMYEDGKPLSPADQKRYAGYLARSKPQ
jgi:hypothetical protein